MAARTVIHIITRLDHGGSAQNTMLTVLGHDRTQYEPMVIAGHPGSWDAQGGMAATEEQGRRLEKQGISCIIMPSLVRPISPWKDLCACMDIGRYPASETSGDRAHTHLESRRSRSSGRLARAGSGNCAYAARPCVLRTLRSLEIPGLFTDRTHPVSSHEQPSWR